MEELSMVGFLISSWKQKNNTSWPVVPVILPELVYVSIRRIVKGNDTIMQESEEKPQLLAMLKT
jgi:hypothetical protein